MNWPVLPKDTIVDHDACIDCPWCAGDMSAAPLTLEQLVWAWTGGYTARPERQTCGTPEPLALTADCPHCQRPSMVALQVRGSGDYREIVVRLLAVRTDTDARLLERTPVT